jgi:O-antigen/teichoic acid export membrane protein
MRNIKNIVSGFFPPIMTAIVGLLLTPITLSRLGLEGFAYWPLCNSLTLYIGLVTMSIGTGLRRHTAYALDRGDIDEAREYFNTGLAMMLVFSFLLTVVGILIATRIEFFFNVKENMIHDVKQMFLFVVFSGSLEVMSLVFFIGVYTSNHLYLEKFARILAPIVRLLFVLTAFALWTPSLKILGMSSLISGVVVFIFSIGTFSKYLPMVEIRLKKYVTHRAMRSLATFGGWILCVAIGDYLFRSFHLIFAIRFLNASDTARYGIVLQVISVIMVGTSHIGYVLSRKLIKPVSGNDNNEADGMLRKYYTWTMCGLALPVAILVGHADTLSMLWLNKNYTEELGSLLRIAIISTFLVEPMSMVNTRLLASQRVAINGISTLLMVPLFCTFLYLFVIRMGCGVSGIAIASGLTLLVRNLILIIDASLECGVNIDGIMRGFITGFVAFTFPLIIIYSRIKLVSLPPVVAILLDGCLGLLVWYTTIWSFSADCRGLIRYFIKLVKPMSANTKIV